VRTAVLAGGKSHPGLRASAEESARSRPGTAFVVAPNQGHAAQFDREAFAAALASVATAATHRLG
jgi:pimeloyl-ACP methyl ester carboxylesterase